MKCAKCANGAPLMRHRKVNKYGDFLHMRATCAPLMRQPPKSSAPLMRHLCATLFVSEVVKVGDFLFAFGGESQTVFFNPSLVAAFLQTPLYRAPC